ncbi:MAG: hypothetical protein QXF25_00120 [Candidatus Pacearchaeota archaeon]
MVKDEPLNEITLRRYEKPYEADKRELVKKICLSLGLLQPGDSRDIIIDILLVLLEAKKNKERLSSESIKERVEKFRKEKNLELKGIEESNIRRQLKRLRDLMLVEKKENLYNITEFESLLRIFENKIEKFLISQTIERIKEYLMSVEQ